MQKTTVGSITATMIALAVCLTGCEPAGEPARLGDGSVAIDGSTTVFPIAQAMAEDMHDADPSFAASVNKSGTGSGFQKFLHGEIDIAMASRPIEPKEDANIKAAGEEYIEVPIAVDGVSVVVNPQNTWVDKLTTSELKAMWNAGSTVRYWSDIRSSFPREKIVFYGPTDNHGTYEYFTEAIDGKKGDIREDCQKDQEPNSTIMAVAGDRDAIGYVGLNYYDQNRDKVKIVPVDSGNGPVVPTTQSIANGAYSPLSRPLFLYVNKRAYDTNPQVKALLQFAISEGGKDDVKEASYVVLPQDLHEAVLRHVRAEKTGTLFFGVSPGAKLSDLYAKEAGR